MSTFAKQFNSVFVPDAGDEEDASQALKLGELPTPMAPPANNLRQNKELKDYDFIMRSHARACEATR